MLIPCGDEGCPISKCFLLFSALYDTTHEIERITGTGGAPTDFKSEGTGFLPCDEYTLSRKDNQPFCMIWKIRGVLPEYKKGKPFTKAQILSIGTRVAAEAKRSYPDEGLLRTRDSNRSLFGVSTNVQIAHIVAFAWFQNYEHRMGALPDEIRDFLRAGSTSSEKINRNSNLLLLDHDYASAFDSGKFSIKLNSSKQYEIVGITSDYLHVDGSILYDGKTREQLQQDTRSATMEPLLLKFQLQCAVLRNLKGGAYPSVWSKEDEDLDAELEEIAIQLSQLTDLSSEEIQKGLNWKVIHDFRESIPVADSVELPFMTGGDGLGITDVDMSGVE